MNQKWIPFAVAWLATTLVVSTGIAGGAIAWGRWEGRKAQKGWNLVPALVATRDLPAGTTLGAGDFADRATPEQFITDSVVRPGEARSAAGRRLLVPMVPGDLLLKSHFARPSPPRCSARADEAATALSVAAHPEVKSFVTELREAEEKGRAGGR